MGIYIPDMKMPVHCIDCHLNYDNCACILTSSRFYKHNMEFDPDEERLSDCPLIPVPPHGRLIDADEIIQDKHQHYEYLSDEFYVTVRDIEFAPTIIPAEKKK